ncbi:MAG: DUF2007 domain-containing protein [Chromatiaceae bacterium]
MGSIPITRSSFLPLDPIDVPSRALGGGCGLSPPMQRLYVARDRIEAQLIHDFLDGHLIRTVVLGDFLSGAVGELPADICPALWVIDDMDLERAREVLARFLAPGASRPDARAWTCPACGELVEAGFDLCWNCGRARPDGSTG